MRKIVFLLCLAPLIGAWLVPVGAQTPATKSAAKAPTKVPAKSASATKKAPVRSNATRPAVPHSNAPKPAAVTRSNAPHSTAPKPTAIRSTAPHSTAQKSIAPKSSNAPRSTMTRRTTAVRPAPRPSSQSQPSQDRYREIQQALKERGYFQTEADGAWGESSSAALKKFQQDQNLPADGKLNSLSLIALGLGPKRMASATPPQITRPQ